MVGGTRRIRGRVEPIEGRRGGRETGRVAAAIGGDRGIRGWKPYPPRSVSKLGGRDDDVEDRSRPEQVHHCGDHRPTFDGQQRFGIDESGPGEAFAASGHRHDDVDGHRRILTACRTEGVCQEPPPGVGLPTKDETVRA